MHPSHQCPNSSSSNYHVPHSSFLIHYHSDFTHTPKPSTNLIPHTTPQTTNITATIITHQTPITTAIPHPFNHPTYNYTDKRGSELDIHTLLLLQWFAVICNCYAYALWHYHATHQYIGVVSCNEQLAMTIHLEQIMPTSLQGWQALHRLVPLQLVMASIRATCRRRNMPQTAWGWLSCMIKTIICSSKKQQRSLFD